MVSTPRLTFEPLAPHHAAELVGALRDPALYAFIPDEPPASVEALAARYRRWQTAAPDGERWRNWLIRTADDGRPVGTLQATILVAERRAVIAYLVFPGDWRRGFGRAGVAWMLATLRDDDGVATVEAHIDPANRASIALVESLGFARAGSVGDDVRYARPTGE